MVKEVFDRGLVQMAAFYSHFEPESFWGSSPTFRAMAGPVSRTQYAEWTPANRDC
jgi:hypothetical protein